MFLEHFPDYHYGYVNKFFQINAWLGTLLSNNADDIYRCKGVLSVAGIEQRFVFQVMQKLSSFDHKKNIPWPKLYFSECDVFSYKQAVHALFEGGTDRPWGSDENRTNKLVFIGKKLDKEALEKGFQECLLENQTKKLQKI